MGFEQTLGRRELLSFLSEFDGKLQQEGFQRRLSIYLLGGSLLSYVWSERLTKDVDFIMSQKDYMAVSGILHEMTRPRKEIDVFIDGEMPGFTYGTFHQHALRIPAGFKAFELYRIDDVGLLVLKVLAGREKDLDDIDTLKNKSGLPPLEHLTRRFSELTLKPGREKEFKQKFSAFVTAYYDVHSGPA